MSRSSLMKYHVIYNPIAGRRKQSRIADIVARLRSNGLAVTVQPTTGPGHAIDLAHAIAGAQSSDVIVAAGGDGTISECATGLLNVLDEGLSDDLLPPLGILPMGTANVMAHDLGIITIGGIARRKITRMLMRGDVRSLRLGQVENALERRAFVMMVGAGFDGDVVAAINPAIKKRWGKLAYVQAGLAAFVAGPNGGARLETNGQPTSVSHWIIVTNGQHYAGGYRLTRRTSLSRHTLAAFAVRGKSRAALARANMCLGANLFDTPFNAQSHVSDRFRIAPANKTCFVEVDGDYFGLAPVDISIAEKPIKILVP
ncbi:MAG: diacylglycerol kinase family protein [Pseudomonadota bacterium]